MKITCSICKIKYFFDIFRPATTCPVCELQKRVGELEQRLFNLENSFGRRSDYQKPIDKRKYEELGLMPMEKFIWKEPYCF